MKTLKALICSVLLFAMIMSIAGCNSGVQNELQSKVDDLQSQIEELNDQLKKRDDKIKELEKELNDLKDEMQDYVLTILASQLIYYTNDDIFIEVALQNRSGVDVEIAYYFLFYPESPTGQFPAVEIPPVTTKKTFKNGEIIYSTENLKGCFPVGKHELKFRAVFYLAWEMTEFGYEETHLNVQVWSNTIEFSVIEAKL